MEEQPSRTTNAQSMPSEVARQNSSDNASGDAPASAIHSGAMNERRALVYGLLAVALWSTVATGFKLGLAWFSAAQLVWLGTVVSWIVFASFALITKQWRLQRTDLTWVIILGLLNPFIYYLILFAAYERLPAHIAQPLNYTWAITLALLSTVVLKQRLARRVMLGIVISYSGVLLLLLTASQPSDTATRNTGWDGWGVALALASTVIWASYWLLNTRLAHTNSSPAVAIMLWSFTAALPCITLVTAVGPGLPELSREAILYGGWVGCIEMGFTFLLWQAALRHTQHAGRLAQLIFLSPFASLLLIHWVLGEHIGWGAVAGVVVIVAGLGITQSNRPAPEERV